mgnify:FL=1
MLVSQISLFQSFALLQIVALLFGINCSEIYQLQSIIISVYSIGQDKVPMLEERGCQTAPVL